MRIKCAGCGKKEKVRFGTWWFKFIRDEPMWIHWPCWKDYENQRKLDGIE